MDGFFDAVVWASSWDRRTLTIAEASDTFEAELGIFLQFGGAADHSGKAESDQVVHASLKRHCASVVTIEQHATEVVAAWEALADTLGKLYVARGRPLRVMMDMTGVPRYLFLSLFARGFQQAVIGTLSLWYVEGIYPSVGTREIVFSTGEWKILEVPGLSPHSFRDLGDHVVASVGFESGRVGRVLGLLDPYRLSVIMPSPGVTAEYTVRTKLRNSSLMEFYQVGDKETIEAPAADPVVLWQRLRAYINQQEGQPANLIYVCGGTKAHSLGLALDALERGTARVVYILPEEHAVVDVAAGPRRWRYDLVNHAAPKIAVRESGPPSEFDGEG